MSMLPRRSLSRHVPAHAPTRPTGRPRCLLIVGCGDVGLRVARRLPPGWQAIGTTTDESRLPILRAAGVRAVQLDLDALAGDPRGRRRLRAILAAVDAVLHLAPPPGQGDGDPRLGQVLAALGAAAADRTRRLVLASTSGVYGDVGGEWIDETRPTAPQTARARRRVAAERRARALGRRAAVSVSVLRIPGIHAADRPGGAFLARARRRAAVLHDAIDGWTNHIHADDLAAACIAALHRGAPQRVYHVVDDTPTRSGDWGEALARAFGLPTPRRVGREELAALEGPQVMSFLGESRRLVNRRMKQELGVRLAHPDAWGSVEAEGGGRPPAA